MVRTQVQLRQDQVVRLKQLARRRGISMAHVVRLAVDSYVAKEDVDLATLYARAMTVVGAFKDKDGATDVAERHDDYLEEAYE